jgi:hypothetical protein
MLAPGTDLVPQRRKGATLHLLVLGENERGTVNKSMPGTGAVLLWDNPEKHKDIELSNRVNVQLEEGDTEYKRACDIQQGAHQVHVQQSQRQGMV